jgi:hypothetical protein
MANQTHSFAQVSRTGSDDSATRRANYKELLVSGFDGFVYCFFGATQSISLSQKLDMNHSTTISVP